MASRRLTRTPRLIIMAAALFLLMGATSASHTVLAHGASNSLHWTLAANGTLYTLTQGKALQVPTILPGGSKGYLVAKYDMSASGVRATVGNNAADPCVTVYSTLQAKDVYGFVLLSYTLAEYTCWDGNTITYHGNPYAQWYSNFGWSMSNHSEFIDYFNATAGEVSGRFRFNGPFGIGCKSGRIDEYFSNQGPSGGNAGWPSEYGC